MGILVEKESRMEKKKTSTGYFIFNRYTLPAASCTGQNCTDKKRHMPVNGISECAETPLEIEPHGVISHVDLVLDNSCVALI